MASVRFVIREDKAVSGLSPIQLNWQYNSNGEWQRFSMATGDKVPAEYWNAETQEAINPKKKREYNELNTYLSGLRSKVATIEQQAKYAGVEITKEFMKAQLKPEKVVKAAKITFMQSFELFIESAPKRTTSNGEKIKTRTIQGYQTIYKHLAAFSLQNKFRMEFENINKTFFDKFTEYMLVTQDMTNNSIGKNIKNLRTMLNWSVAEGHTTSTTFVKTLKVWKEPTDIIHLTIDEYQNLYDLDLTKNERLAYIRDAFCFACSCGLRYQDVANLRWVHIKNDYLELTTQKTKQKARIPLNEYSLDILAKYRGQARPLHVISNQKTNDYLKELGELAGINQEIERTRYKGSEALKEIMPKYQFLSFHDARRTFVTLSLEKGMLPSEIMEITGHSTIKMLEKYIKITDKGLKASTTRAWANPNKLKSAKVEN